MKKIISFLLAALLLVSAVPTALATNDYSQGTQVVYQATGSESYTITVPAQLAPGGSGTVTLQGTWADNRIITVTAEPTVTLTNSIKAEDQKVLNVHFDGISEAGSNTSKQTFTEPVSVDGISNALFGTWSGKFNYNVDSTTEEVVPPAENYIGTVSADNTITLSGVESAGTYTLRYANANGALENYADICSLEVTDPATAVSYDDLIAENCAPVEATTIAVYNAADEKVGNIALGSLDTSLGTKLYSFGALSDIHINANTAESDLQNALTYLNQTENVAFIGIAGDLTNKASDSQFEIYKNIVDEYSSGTPVYAITGNHDINPNYQEYTGIPNCYSFTYNDDVFIMLGMANEYYDILAEDAIPWLYDTLEANKGKRCFLFVHYRPDGVSDNPLGIYNNDLWGTYGGTFDDLLEYYPNISVFHGHTHIEFAIQSMSDTVIYEKVSKYNSIHIPSLSSPRTGTGSGTTEYLDEASEGYVVDVYENGIVLRGRDFAGEKFLPIAHYFISTTLQAAPTNTFYEETRTVIDKTKSGVVEDEDGETRYYKYGISLGAGLVQDEAGNYYYISTSNKVAVKDCAYYITATNDLLPAGTYGFDSDGKINFKTGIFEENETLYYYVNGVKQKGAGLILYEGNYYFVRSEGQLCVNSEYSIPENKTNGLLPAGRYAFDETGKMILEQ